MRGPAGTRGPLSGYESYESSRIPRNAGPCRDAGFPEWQHGPRDFVGNGGSFAPPDFVGSAKSLRSRDLVGNGESFAPPDFVGRGKSFGPRDFVGNGEPFAPPALCVHSILCTNIRAQYTVHT